MSKKRLIIAGAAIVATLGFGGLATAASASDTPTHRPGHSHSTDVDQRNDHNGVGNDNDQNGVGNGNEVEVEAPINVQIWDTLKGIF